MCHGVYVGSRRVLQECGFQEGGCYDRATDPQVPHFGQCELRFELSCASHLDQSDRYALFVADITI